MPYSQDYVKRLIEQFGEFLLALKRLLTENRLDQAREQLDRAYREALGLDPQFVRDAPDDYLILLSGLGRVGDMDKSAVLADLLTVDGDWHELQGDYETAQRCYCKATHVLTEALLRQPFGTSRDYVERIDALADKLAQYDVPPDTRERLFRYHERTHAYAAAEDDLYHMLEAAPDDRAVLEAGLAFYERLLQLPDHHLLLGGLPRSEVEEGQRALAARLSAL